MKHFISAFLAVFCAVCMFLSCSEQRKNTPTDIKEIIFKDPSKDYLLASNFKNIHMVQLEMKDECVISDVKRIIDTDGQLYVLTSDNEIFCFDRSTGKYLRKIGSIGEGPGEYVDITDMFYNEKEKRICVVDRVKNAIHAYTLGGEFVGSRAFDKNGDIATALIWSECAEYSPDGDVMIALQITDGFPVSDYAYTVIRPNGTAIKLDAFAPLKIEGTSMAFAKRPMARCEDGLRFFKYVNDTIFTLSDGEAVPYCKVDLGRKMPSREMLAKMGGDLYLNIDKVFQSGYAMPLEEIYECKNLIALIPQYYEMAGGYYWIDKEKQEGIHIIATNNFDDECFRFLQGRSIISLKGSNEKELISSFNGATVIKAVQKQLREKKDLNVYKKEMRTFFEKADPDGNPCLVFYEN